MGIATVSVGGFGGGNCLAQLRGVFLTMGAVPVPARLPVARVQEAFAEDGTLLDGKYEDRTNRFLDEFLWLAAALRDRRHSD